MRIGVSPHVRAPIGWMAHGDVSGVPDSLERKLQLCTTTLLAQALTGVNTWKPRLRMKPCTAVTASGTQWREYIGDLFAVAGTSVVAYSSLPSPPLSHCKAPRA